MKKDNTLSQLILLISVFIIGVFLLISLHLVFLNLIDKLDKETENLKSKIQVGEHIVHDIHQIRSDFYELTTTATNKRGRELINKKILNRIKLIEESLKVLEQGGTLKRTIRLNIANHNSIDEEITYRKDDDTISMEAIDLSPKLVEFKEMLNRLNEMLLLQANFQKTGDIESFFKQNKNIKRFYKSTPAFFVRISENASRLLYEGSIELQKIEKELEKQKKYYTKLELYLIGAIILISIILGILIALKINKNTALISKQKKFARGTLDAQDNIVIVTDGFDMVDANKALLKFFDEYKSFEEFKAEHDCVCDFFIEIKGEDFIGGQYHKNKLWVEYILLNPHKQHHIAMMKGDVINYFLIKATKNFLDGENSIVIITLNNVTKEIESQKELKELNENLEQMVGYKTKELKKLNENLEQKVYEEVQKNREKDRAMIQQARFAALGEMLGNIAHQWRQPLSAITSTATSIQVQMQLDLASKEDIKKSYVSIIKYVDFLNQTIEDFRGFFRIDKEKESFSVKEKLNNATNIIQGVYKNKSISIVIDENNKKYISLGYPNEVSQVFLNILNNSKDVLLDRNIDKKLVFIEFNENKKHNIVEIYDNAGGIDEQIIQKVFDPYFTTKHKSKGTGIGLYMSKYIVENNMNGTLSVQNKKFNYEDKEYIGASFKIELPKI